MSTVKSKIPVIKGRNFNLPVFEKQLKIQAKDLKVDEDSRTVSGYLAVFGNRDDDGDILVKGCFAKSILERGPQSSTNRKIAFCWQHDIKDPIGRFTVLREDDYGLYFEAVLDEGVANADRALTQLKSGTLDQFSIGYLYVWENCEWDMATQSLVCKELNLFEGSVVTFGCNEMTYFAGFKSSKKIQVRNELFEQTEDFIKCLPRQYQYEARQMISKNIQLASALKKKDTVDDNTDPDDDPNISFVSDAIDNLQAGIDMCDDYSDDIDDDDVSDDLEDMKQSHMDLMTKMDTHLQNLSGTKSLKHTKPARKPRGKQEPTATGIDTKQLFQNLQIS